MMRFVLALGLVAAVGACRPADDQPAQQPAGDTMTADTMMMGDTTQMMAGDTGRRM
jgi:hypothetical protein